MTGFIPFRTLYVRPAGGRVGASYLHLLPKRLTLRPEYVARREFSNHDTLFKQVDILPFEESLAPDVWGLFRCKQATRCESRKDLFDNIRRVLTNIVLTYWDSKSYHIVLHSSGLDSRILSCIIRDCAEEQGSSWLGRGVVFLCSKWEGRSFKEIMAYEGWDESQYAVVAEDTKDKDYYAKWLTSFKYAWWYAGGVAGIPVNLFMYPAAWARDRGYIPAAASVQVLNAQWGNTILDQGSAERDAAAKIMRIVRDFYLHILSARPKFGEPRLEPFASIALARTIVSSSIRLGKGLRPLFLEYLDEGLAKFDNMMSDGDRHRRISDHLVDRMVEDYRNSWYGKAVHPKAVPAYKTTEFQPFWSHWTAASLCDHLLQQGHTIEIG